MHFKDAALPTLSVEVFFELDPSAKQLAARAATNGAILR
jgi:hypothetical protein